MARVTGTNAPGTVRVTANPASGYTAAVGDLVYFSTGGNWEVTQAAANKNPDGLVEVVNPDGTLTVRCFGNPSFEELPYVTTGPALGQKVEGSATRGAVTLDNTNGRGYCVAVDWPTTGKCVIAYNLTGAGSGA